MNFSRTRQPAGLILLVVLSMLAFLGVLVIAYVSFSSKSQRTSFALASREFHAPPVDDLFEEALMKLVRGTGDPTDPFYGEDLLTDLYGRKDLLNVSVMTPMSLREQSAGGTCFRSVVRYTSAAGLCGFRSISIRSRIGTTIPRTIPIRVPRGRISMTRLPVV